MNITIEKVSMRPANWIVFEKGVQLSNVTSAYHKCQEETEFYGKAALMFAWLAEQGTETTLEDVKQQFRGVYGKDPLEGKNILKLGGIYITYSKIK